MHSTGDAPFWRDQEDIVISGISGRFPRSENVQEFGDLLMAGEDLITEDDLRWPPGNEPFFILMASNVYKFYQIPLAGDTRPFEAIFRFTLSKGLNKDIEITANRISSCARLLGVYMRRVLNGVWKQQKS